MLSNSTLNTSPSGFYSTNLNPRVKSYEKLATRIAYSLGYPQINIEAHIEQVYDNIAQACELFTKFAGYTSEYLMFDASLYEAGKGLRIDTLFSITPEMQSTYDTYPSDVSIYSLSNMVIGDPNNPFRVLNDDDSVTIQKSYDYLLSSYRRVVDVAAFEEGTSSGTNTLFTIEQTLAQQTYFSYALGKYGFDLVSWYTMKDWIDVRGKLLSQDYFFRFDDRRQTLHLIPEPRIKSNFYGLVNCYVEKPVEDIVKEPWVFQYALALTKITLGRIRGKYAGTGLFGGGTVSDTILQEGITERDSLIDKLENGTAGYGDADPPLFFVG